MSTSPEDRILVVVPCRDGERYLQETLDSVARQDCESWRCVVVDDGSTDRSALIVEAMASRDERFVLMRQPPRGLPAARNAGIRSTDDPYIFPLDADDLIAPSYLRTAREVLKANPEARIVCAKARVFGAEEGPSQLPPFSVERLLMYNVLHYAALYRRSTWERVGGYREELREGLEDWDFWLGVMEKDPGLVIEMPEVLFSYRVKERGSLRIAFSNNPRAAEWRDEVFACRRALYRRVLGSPFEAYREYHLMRRLKEFRVYEAAHLVVQGLRSVRARLASACGRTRMTSGVAEGRHPGARG